MCTSSGTSTFPYRLVYQDASSSLPKGAVAIFSADQYAGKWTEPADTLIVNSNQSLSITHSLQSIVPAGPQNIWLPLCIAPDPAPAILLEIAEYKFVDEGECYTYWIDRVWTEVCDPDVVRYSIYVKVPVAVDAMWMLRPGDLENGERVQMWRSSADEPGYVKYRPPMRGTTTYVPEKLEYTVDSESFTDAYAPDCAWEEGQGRPPCWIYPMPE